MSIPASVLDLNHGVSRRFADFYTFEKLPPMSVRVRPKMRPTGGSAGRSAAAAAASTDSKTGLEGTASQARKLGTEAKSGSMVGRGAYSSVRVGTHISTGDCFAIKQISKRFLYSEEEREAIRREVRIHCSPDLVHDNIVFLYDYFEDGENFYLVMDHCEGGDLETCVRACVRVCVLVCLSEHVRVHVRCVCTYLCAHVRPTSRLNCASAVCVPVSAVQVFNGAHVCVHCWCGVCGVTCRYMRVNKRKGITELQAQMLFQQLMTALAHLHDQNIIHGDIKPQNVLLSKKPFSVVKICDFGNARYAKDVRYFSKTGSVSKVPYTSIMGTQGYIAPEILAKQHYGTGIDMWAAGIMCVQHTSSSCSSSTNNELIAAMHACLLVHGSYLLCFLYDDFR